MKIARIAPRVLDVPVPVRLLGVERTLHFGVCLVEVETDGGVAGLGFTAITEPAVVARAIEAVAAPAVLGADALATERVWEALYRAMCPRGQTGYGCHAIAAIDVALWDIKGKAAGLPVWRLLGGARSSARTYATFGLDVFDRDQLADAAKLWVANGHHRLKMVVGHGPHTRRDPDRPLGDIIREDRERVRAVREAVGEAVELFVDANCTLDAYHACALARLIAPYGISFFEEPITQNDIRQMADLRRRQPIPLACGQNEGLAYRFRDMLIHEAVDIVQPNVVITGGFTQCAKIAGMAAAFNVGVANGGAWPHFNMHLQAGVSNGGYVEWHYGAVELCKRIFLDLPEPVDGEIALAETPGLGLVPNAEAIAAHEVAA